MLMVVFFAVATVSARRISTDNIRDHSLAQPKTEFGSFGDGRVEDFGDRDVKHIPDSDNGDRTVKTEFSSRSFGERHKPGNPEFHEFSSFNTHFKHHHFRHSSNGGSDTGFGSQNRGFGSGFTGQSEFQNRGIDEHNYKDIGSSFRQNTEEKRTHGIETLGHEFGSEDFGSERRQHEFDRNLESHTHSSVGFQGSSQGFQSTFGSDNFGSHSSQARSIENFNHRNSDNRFDHNSNGHGTDQSFGSENTNRQNVKNHKPTDINSQVNKNKEEFEIISATNKRIQDNQDKENIHDMRTPDQDKEKNRETENRNTSTNNDKVQHNQNTKTKTHNINRQEDIVTERRRNSGATENDSNSRSNQNPDLNTSKENEVTNISNQDTPDVSKNNTSSQGKEETDRWIWSGGNEKKKEVTTTTAAPGLADRAAFNGDKCPTGMIKIGTTCIPVE